MANSDGSKGLDHRLGDRERPKVHRTNSSGISRNGQALPGVAGLIADHVRQCWESTATFEPPRYGQPFRTPMWDFVRCVKQHPMLSPLSPFEVAEMVSKALMTWRELQGPDLWKAAFPKSEDPQAEFVYTW